MPPPDLPRLLPRPSDSHKGDFGRVLVVAGSVGMSGAAVLCGLGALRAGAGLVRIACPAPVQPLIAQAHPCLMTFPVAADAEGRLAASAWVQVRELLSWADVLAYGPGLGQSANLDSLLIDVLANCRVPIVLDADGLNALARLLARNAAPQASGQLVLTPHPGEFARLWARPFSTTEAMEAAADLARRLSAVVLVKGNRTLITDGRRLVRNDTGNPGMATGGSGDVLTGVIAGLLGQKLPPFEASVLGAYVHGLAGDLAAREVGPVGLLATDLLDRLPRALHLTCGCAPSTSLSSSSTPVG